MDDGAIFSQSTGQTLIDKENKKISVYPKTKTPNTPKKGAEVVAQVGHTQDKVANVKILKVGDSDLTKPFAAVLHVSFAAPYFARSMHEVAKQGDIITARVLGDENQPYQLTTAERDLGVIFAYCSVCGGPLRYSQRTLTCSVCGNTEKRKTSDKYGKTV